MDSINWTQYLAAVFVLAGLLGALGLMAMAVRRGWILNGIASLRGDAPKHRRLAIEESLLIDPRRRVVILRSDETEHVVLLGGTTETLLSSGPARPREEPEEKTHTMGAAS
jgi:flagellar protein FliO/FliZ